MKALKVSGLLVICIFILICHPLFSADTRQQIVILNFKAANIEKDIAYAVSENLITAFADLNVYRVIERSQLNAILDELKLTAEDDFDDAAAIEIGKLAGSQLVLIGSVTKLGKVITINARGIEVATGNVLFGRSIDTASESSLPDAIRDLASIICYDNGKKTHEYIDDTDSIPRDDEHDDEQWFISDSPYFKKIDTSARAKKDVELIDTFPVFSPDKKARGIEVVRHVSEEAKEIVSVGSELYKTDDEAIRWEYEFNFKKTKSKGNRKEMWAEAALVFHGIDLPKNFTKNGGIYLIIKSSAAGKYELGIHTPELQAGRSLFITEELNEYFLPFSSFKIYDEGKKKKPPKGEKKHKTNISLFKTMRSLRETVGFEGGDFASDCIVEKVGIFMYKENTDKGVIANFDNPLDKSRLELHSGIWAEPKVLRKALQDEVFVIHYLDHGTSDEDGNPEAGDYYYIDCDFTVGEAADDFDEGGFGFGIDIRTRDVEKYKAVSFLLKGQGAYSINCILGGDHGHELHYHQEVPLSREWVRVVIPFSEFYNKEQKGKNLKLKWVKRIGFTIDKHNMVRHHDDMEELPGDYSVDFQIDEIKFIR